MAKPIGIALGVVGAKAPLPAEAMVAHAQALQAPPAQAPAVEAPKPKRSRKSEPEAAADGDPAGDGPTIALNLAAEADA
jgi:hypothetical protein